MPSGLKFPTKAFELREQCNTAAYERCPQFSSVLRTLRSNTRHNEAAGDREVSDTAHPDPSDTGHKGLMPGVTGRVISIGDFLKPLNIYI